MVLCKKNKAGDKSPAPPTLRLEKYISCGPEPDGSKLPTHIGNGLPNERMRRTVCAPKERYREPTSYHALPQLTLAQLDKECSTEAMQ